MKMKISYFARKSKPSKHLDIPFYKICDIVATTVHTAVFTFNFFWFWQFFSKFDFDFYHTESQSKKAKVKSRCLWARDVLVGLQNPNKSQRGHRGRVPDTPTE